MNELTAIALLCVLTEEQIDRFKDVLTSLTANLEPSGSPEAQAQAQVHIQKNIAEADRLFEHAMRYRRVLSQAGLPPLRIHQDRR